MTRSETKQHRAHAIEERVAVRDVCGGDVAPGHGDTKRGASFLVRAERGRKSREPMTCATTAAFGEIQSDRGESTTKLLAEIPIVLPNASHERTKNFHGLNRNIESLKGRFRLHALSQRKNRDDAKILSRVRRGRRRGSFALRAGKRKRP